jgi:hypothetical protein
MLKEYKELLTMKYFKIVDNKTWIQITNNNGGSINFRTSKNIESHELKKMIEQIEKWESILIEDSILNRLLDHNFPFSITLGSDVKIEVSPLYTLISIDNDIAYGRITVNEFNLNVTKEFKDILREYFVE